MEMGDGHWCRECNSFASVDDGYQDRYGDVHQWRVVCESCDEWY